MIAVIPCNINGVAVETDNLREALNYTGEIIESVAELATSRHVGLTEARKIRSYHVESIGTQRNLVAEYMTSENYAAAITNLVAFSFPASR
jgi:hypothetical protein